MSSNEDPRTNLEALHSLGGDQRRKSDTVLIWAAESELVGLRAELQTARAERDDPATAHEEWLASGRCPTCFAEIGRLWAEVTDLRQQRDCLRIDLSTAERFASHNADVVERIEALVEHADSATGPWVHVDVLRSALGVAAEQTEPPRVCVHGNNPLTCDHRPDGPCISGPDPVRECARILMALVDGGKSWLQDVNGVETAVIGVTDAAKLLSGFSAEQTEPQRCGHPNHGAADHDCTPFVAGLTDQTGVSE